MGNNPFQYIYIYLFNLLDKHSSKLCFPGLLRYNWHTILYELSLSQFFHFIFWHNWASLVAQTVKSLPATQETGFNAWVGKMPWRREWLPTSVFLPGEFHGERSLLGYSPQCCKELNTSDWLTLSLYFHFSSHNYRLKSILVQCLSSFRFSKMRLSNI